MRYGKDEKQMALVDMYLDGMSDVRSKRDPLRYYDGIDDATKEQVSQEKTNELSIFHPHILT